MKLVFKTLIASVTVASALLTACGKSSTGSTPTSGGVGANSACVYDASGNCTLQVGPAANIGAGSWTGSLPVNNLPILQQFAADNGLCALNTTVNNYGGFGQQNLSQYNCGAIAQQIQIQVRLQNGCVPNSQGQFSISLFGGNGQLAPLRVNRAQVYQNTASNGFFMVYQTGSQTNNLNGFNGLNGINTFGNLAAAGSTQVMPANSLLVQMQWIDGTHNTQNIQLFYRGQQIAAGQVTGNSMFATVGNNQAYCGAGNGGFGAGNGFGGFGGGSNWNGMGQGQFVPISTQPNFDGGFGGGGGGFYYEIDFATGSRHRHYRH